LAADTSGNWNLDDGSGHRLGAVLFERSDINSPSGLRLRLNAESAGLKLDHTHPLVLRDGNQQTWNLENLSQELLTTAGASSRWIPPNTTRAASIQSLPMASRCR
jgi:hypothetical protein